MTDPLPISPETGPLDEAATWHARLDDNASEAEWMAFASWLEADPCHRAAFDAMEAAAGAAVAHLVAAGEATTARADAAPRYVPHRWHVRALWAGAALAATVLLALIVLPRLTDTPERTTVATMVGERREVTLADGSALSLNTDTEIEVSLGRDRRTARLEKGEALFRIVRDAARPFTVAVGDRTISVTGTAFNVLRHDGTVTVTVESGAVAVATGTRGAVRLDAGDQYLAREGADSYRIAETDPAAALAWREGRIVFTEATLSEVASMLSRYFTRPIVLADADLAGLRFSGILKIEDDLTTARRLEAFLPVAVQDGEDEVRLLRGSSK